jgi:hypothetical protein
MALSKGAKAYFCEAPQVNSLSSLNKFLILMVNLRQSPMLFGSEQKTLSPSRFVRVNLQTVLPMSYLDFLIQDCLGEYANDYPDNSEKSQITQTDKSMAAPLPSIEEKLFGSKSTNVISPVSPLTPDTAMCDSTQPAQTYNSADVAAKLLTIKIRKWKIPPSNANRFFCDECDKSYRGKRELLRHQRKHNTPDDYVCTVVGCTKTSYRVDVMRLHIKSHEKRALKEGQALFDS